MLSYLHSTILLWLGKHGLEMRKEDRLIKIQERKAKKGTKGIRKADSPDGGARL